MVEKFEYYTILGCNGRQDNSFVFCPSQRNIIINSSAQTQEEFDEVIKFFDKTCNMFSCKITDRNKVLNIINILHHDYNQISKAQMLNIENFCNMHRLCGIYLALILPGDFYERKNVIKLH
jgi:hypothetical protein